MKLLTESFESMFQRMGRLQRELREGAHFDALFRTDRRFKNFDAGTTITGADAWTADASAKHRLGTRAVTVDGRVFHYARIGGVAAVAGSVYQASAPVPNHLALTPAAAAIGSLQVTATLGATAATANQYAEGFLQVDTTPGNGLMYGIASHPAIASSGVGLFTLYNDEAIQVALTTSSRVGLIANPYADVIVTPTTATAVIAGVPLVAAPIGSFCWLQTWGPAPVLINGTPGVGTSVVPSATTAGAVDVATVAAEVNTRFIGRMMQVGVSTKNNAVYLMIKA